MKYEMIPCSEDDTEFIEEQADNAFNAIAQPEEDAEEEYVYIVTDESGNREPPRWMHFVCRRSEDGFDL